MFLKFMQLVRGWTNQVFEERAEEFTPKIRALRLLEEITELAQAEGVNEAEARIILLRVYEKPAGKPYQELGGTMVTLLSYCDCAGHDPAQAFIDEYIRILNPRIMEKVPYRYLEGDKIGFRKK